MYFSGVESDAIIIDDRSNRRITINLELFIRVLNDRKQNTRVFLELLKIGGNDDGRENHTEQIVSKGHVFVDLGNIRSVFILVFTSRALITAEFREE